MFEELMERVKYYKKLGVNPLSLATGCAVKVDLDRVVYPALSELRPKLEKKGLRIAPREDADIFPRTSGGVEVHRRIYTLGPQTNVDPGDVARIGPCRAITVIQVYQRYANQPERFAELVGPVYEKLAEAGVPIHLGKGHSIATPFEEDQFALFDFLKPSGGREEGFTAANNDTMHIIDPTEEPGDYRQVAGALSNTLNDLFVLGVHENLRLALVINAPIEELAEKMRRNAEEFASKLGAEIIEVPQPTRGRLLIGATAIGDTQKHPPTFYGEARPGMKLVATRPFGELAPINVYISAVIDESVVEELEENGITVEELERELMQLDNQIMMLSKEIERIEKQKKELFQKGVGKSDVEKILLAEKIKDLDMEVKMKLKEYNRMMKQRRALSNLIRLKKWEARLKEKGIWEKIKSLDTDKLMKMLSNVEFVDKSFEDNVDKINEILGKELETMEIDTGTKEILELWEKVEKAEMTPETVEEKLSVKIEEKEKEVE